MAGISGFAGYFPAPCVDLADWAQWTGNSVQKLHAVVGQSFRMCPPDENVYTMAAEAVLSLICNYDIDPARVGFLGLGTESSTDNSAGAVIVKGLVNRALAQMGRSGISRACEVPEVKHACLGGIYAMKSAIRFLETDGADELAIVVAADIAVYAPGSSGEQTQGAGAVAILLEANPQLLSIDLKKSRRASSYRHADFRKPLLLDRPKSQFHYPVFQGPYSTACYIESLISAASDLFDGTDEAPMDHLARYDAIFLHRPYQRMAETGAAFLYLLAMAKAGDARLAELARDAGVELEGVVDELLNSPELTSRLLDGAAVTDVFERCHAVVRSLRADPAFLRFKAAPGANTMQSLGNLYTASLPAWIAAGLQEAVELDTTFECHELLAVGYGSGDATEILPMTMMAGWQTAAVRINLIHATAFSRRLVHDEYQALQSGEPITDASSAGFRLTTPGQPDEFGVEGYAYHHG